jgi:hypothetical protein
MKNLILTGSPARGPGLSDSPNGYNMMYSGGCDFYRINQAGKDENAKDYQILSQHLSVLTCNFYVQFLYR